ncbi:MAG: hypothetical protein ACRDTD_29025, partial [Pseudonocardiaceae bacterium]
TGAPEIAGWLSVESAAPDAGLPAASRPPTLFPRGEDTMPAEATRAADDPLISLPPHVLRLLPESPGQC